MSKHVSSLLSVALLLLLPCDASAFPEEPADAYIRAILQGRVENDKKSVGIVVGIVSDKGTRIISHGKPDHQGGRALDGDTVFEIGSITKVFTTLLLADMVEKGKVNLSDPAAKYLPKSVKVATKSSKEMTLFDLATHTSGLPRMPGNFTPKDISNPYADYTVAQLYDSLSGYTPTRDVGEKYEYSNLGTALLGDILARKAGTDYETLVIERICKPLGMGSTRIKLSPAMQARLAAGHDRAGKAVPNWDLPAVAGAGALRSTVNDIVKFLAANLGLKKSGLLPAMRKTHRAQKSTGIPYMSIALGWHVDTEHGAEIAWHGGATGGYYSFVGFDQKKRLGVVVLSNSVNRIDDIGFHLLESKYELISYQPRKERKTIKMDPKVYDTYVGQYELSPQFIVTVTRDGDRFYVQATAQGKIEIFAESERKFYTEADTQIIFQKDEEGRVTRIVLRQKGEDQVLKKIK